MTVSIIRARPISNFMSEAPLLRDPDAEDTVSELPQDQTFAERLHTIAQEPLTPLSKILLALTLIFLLLTSVTGTLLL